MGKESFVYSLFRKKQGPINNNTATKGTDRSQVSKSQLGQKSQKDVVYEGDQENEFLVSDGSNGVTSVVAPSDIVANHNGFQLIGEGTYGMVYKAISKHTGKPVALKKIRLTADDHSDRLASTGISTTAVREILLLRELKHPNVVELQSVSFCQSPSIQLWLTFEYCPMDLRQYVKCIAKSKKAISCKPPPEWATGGGVAWDHVKRFTQQILAGLSFIHSMNILHRDLKPQNILMWMPPSIEKEVSNEEAESSSSSDEYLSQLKRHLEAAGNHSRTATLILNNWTTCVSKIADLGLARSAKLLDEQMTQEVVTLWYRPPELLLGAANYSEAVDVWSVGCIIAEMVSGRPLFSGDSEIDTLYKIFQTLGTPQDESVFGVSEDSKLPYFKSVFPKWVVEDPKKTLTNILLTGNKSGSPPPVCERSELVVDLIWKCLQYKPLARISTLDAMKHPFLACFNS